MSEIYDPLAAFHAEEDARTAGIKNPQTGIREDAETVQHKLNQEEYAKRKKEVSKRIIIQLMHDELGREWLYDLLNICHVFDIPFTDIPPFNSGKTHIGKRLEADIKHHAIKMYCTMLEEGWEREKMWADSAS
jgi:transcriptional regulator with XRE-family HTH domain